MGALTLKSLAFYLRNWDTEKSESVDPTDGFGSNVRIYINNNRIVQIEPEYSIHTFNTWLTDKSRQFFDGIFCTEAFTKHDKENSAKNSTFKSWSQIIKNLTQVIYLYDHCNQQKTKKYFFTIIFENVSLEVLSLLLIMSQNYSFINLKRAETFKVDNDLESNFQLNLTTSSKIKLTNSSMCILLSTNTRYEGYFLNLSLRQRFFKGNFKCFSVGSLIDFTFPVISLGSNLNAIKSISEGNNLICQSLKSAKNPLLIYNSDLAKRSDGTFLIKTLQTLKHANIFDKAWNSISCFSSTLSETGNQSLAKVLPMSKNDINNFSILYWLNVNTKNISNFKKLTNFKLLSLKLKTLNIQKLLIDQGFLKYRNLNFYHNNFNPTKVNYYSSQVSMFYENEETFINTEGLIKRTTKIIFRKQTKNQWQLLRKIFKHLKTNFKFLNDKNNQLIFFDLKNRNKFKNFVYFQYQATQFLINLNFHLLIKTNSFFFMYKTFKNKQQKLFSTKLKYWLDDFYSGGRDDYSQNSSIMANCSKLLRSQSTNFF